MKVKGQSQG